MLASPPPHASEAVAAEQEAWAAQSDKKTSEFLANLTARGGKAIGNAGESCLHRQRCRLCAGLARHTSMALQLQQSIATQGSAVNVHMPHDLGACSVMSVGTLVCLKASAVGRWRCLQFLFQDYVDLMWQAKQPSSWGSLGRSWRAMCTTRLARRCKGTFAPLQILVCPCPDVSVVQQMLRD